MKKLQIGLFVGVIIVSSYATIAMQNANSEVMQILVDTDAGTDDAMAILYMLRAEKYAIENKQKVIPKIIGITCANGNTNVNNVVNNILRILKLVDRLDIPVYKGASRSLKETSHFPSGYFGEDGLGDIPDPNPPENIVKAEHAANALIRAVNEHPYKVTILALGPLTNLALAIRMDDEFLMKTKKVIILGGAVSGQGNIFPGVEFNFYVDPIATYVVLNGSDFRQGTLSIMPWEAVLATNITMGWRKKVLGALTSPEIQLLNAAEHMENFAEDDLWNYADPIIAAATLTPDLIGVETRYAMTVVTEGPLMGGLAVDYLNTLNSTNKIGVMLNVDVERYKDLLIKHFN